MSRFALSFILSILFGSMILVFSYMGVVEGEFDNPETNVSKLGTSTTVDNSVKLQNKTVEYYQDS